jgi:hypothetical protein
MNKQGIEEEQKLPLINLTIKNFILHNRSNNKSSPFCSEHVAGSSASKPFP